MILGELLERVYRSIHADVVDGVATGGSATTIVDSGLSSKSFTENRFKDWIAIVTRTTDGLTPQGKYGIATAYVKSTGTITIPTVTDTVAVGDEYALCKPDIPLYTLIKLCNDGLRQLGRISVWDRSLTTAASTLRYTLPLAAKGVRLRKLILEDADYNPSQAPSYEIENAVGGSTASIVFKSQPPTDMTVAFNYSGYHPALTVYNSYVNETIHDELAIAACVERAFYWKAMPKQRKIDMQNWNLAKGLLQEAMTKYPIERPIIDNQRLPAGLMN